MTIETLAISQGQVKKFIHHIDNKSELINLLLSCPVCWILFEEMVSGDRYQDVRNKTIKPLDTSVLLTLMSASQFEVICRCFLQNRALTFTNGVSGRILV